MRKIANFSDSAIPGYRFEWHPEIQKVYIVPLPTPEQDAAAASRGERVKVQAWVLAEHCDTHAMAYGYVQTWCRGYKAGRGAPIAAVT